MWGLTECERCVTICEVAGANLGFSRGRGAALECHPHQKNSDKKTNIMQERKGYCVFDIFIAAVGNKVNPGGVPTP